jgi:hypothetical protein
MESSRDPHPPPVSPTSKRTRRLWPVLVAAAFVACAPRVTIIDETDSDAGGGGSATGGASGGMTTGGTTPTFGGTATGGTTPTFGGTGGSAPQAGSGNFPGGGTAGAGTIPESCAQNIDRFLPASCDARAAMTYCAKSGCHNTSQEAGDLNLAMDDFLVARILNVHARLETAEPTSAGGFERCVLPACPSDALLLDQQSPADSWMFRKMADFIPGETTTTFDMGCGDAMPTYNTTGTSNYSSESKACLMEFFNNILRLGVPCPPVIDARPERAPPCGDGGAAGD